MRKVVVLAFVLVTLLAFISGVILGRSIESTACSNFREDFAEWCPEWCSRVRRKLYRYHELLEDCRSRQLDEL